GPRQVVKVERVGPEGAAGDVRPRGPLADNDGVTRPVHDTGESLLTRAAGPVGVQESAKAGSLPHVDLDLRRVAGPLVKAGGAHATHAAVAAGPECDAVIAAVVGPGLRDEQLVRVHVRRTGIGRDELFADELVVGVNVGHSVVVANEEVVLLDEWQK